MKHSVFISYRHCDEEIARHLRLVFESNGIPCWIDSSGIRPSEAWDEKIAHAISESEMLVLLITPGSEQSPKEQKREISVAEKYDVPIVPVFTVPPQESEAFDYLLATTQYIDATKPPLLDRLEEVARHARQLLSMMELARLKAMQKGPPQAPAAATTPAPAVEKGKARRGLSVAVLYKRGVAEDERLMDLLYRRLSARGHTVFVDRQLEVGAEWRRVIREKVENADAVIPLLSMFSVGSEMLEEELRIAAQHQQTSRDGKPRTLPVRINYEGALPPGLAHYVQRLQYVLWRGPQDDEALVQALVDALEKPQQPPATVGQQTEAPSGAMPLTSPFYIVRDRDRVFNAALERRDGILLVKGARQMGKTSLIARGLQLAREKGWRVAITDLQTLNESDFKDLESFYIALANELAAGLEIETKIETVWDKKRAKNVNFQEYLEDYVLEAAEEQLVWAIDEADRLFPCGFGTEVFGLFRTWYNARALKPGSPLSRLTLVIGFATEASLFIRDVNMSPFNVGTMVALTDFTQDEVAGLNARYGNPLQAEEEIDSLMERVGGQPYLVRRSLYAMAVEGVPLDKLLADSATDHGIFSDHLRRFYLSLHRDRELEKAMRNFIQRGKELTVDQFHRLRSAGLVVGEARQDAVVRCGIYNDYLKRHLA
jgi:hypothetical protein